MINEKQKELSDKTIQPSAVPERVTISLLQHVGAPCQPVVKRGDKVKVGTLIGKSVGLISSNIHSSVSGTVLEIDKDTDENGYPNDAVIIHVEGDEWEETIDRSPIIKEECLLPADTILEKIATAGVVGLGSMPFPTHVKLTPPPETEVDILLIDGTSGEPWLTGPHLLMLEKTEEICVGISIVMEILHVKKCVIAINKEKDKKDVIAKFISNLNRYPAITIEKLKVKKTKRSEKEMVKALTGRKIPDGAIPISTGAVTLDVETVFAIYEAVQKNKPLIERIVTVARKKTGQSYNLLTRIGTPVASLMEKPAGKGQEITGELICGDSMTRKKLTNTEVPVTKEISGILLT